MFVETVGKQKVVLTNGLVFMRVNGCLVIDPDPEEFCPIALITSQFDHTMEWRMIWKHDYERSQSENDEAEAERLEYEAASRKQQQEWAQNRR